jgi:type IV pilus assembly protein PilM
MQVCPFGLEEASLDYQLLRWERGSQSDAEVDSGPLPITGILTVARHEAIDFKRTLIARAGARCVLMDIDGLALLNAAHALRPGQDTETSASDPVAVLHVGHAISTLAIGAPHSAPFVRDIPYAAQAMAEEMADNQGPFLQPSKAELQQVCRAMADQVNETLRYYAAQQSGPTPRALWISGGFATVPGFAEELNRVLARATVRPWNPLEQLDYADEELPAPGSAFAVAIGLAMRVL